MSQKNKCFSTDFQLYYMSEEKLRVLMKVFAIAQLRYCPLKIWIFQSKKLNNHIIKIHEKVT